MGYTIVIGNAVIGEHGNDPEENELRVIVRAASLPSAPTFPGHGADGGRNTRNAPYGGWEHFCRVSGLHALFLDKSTGLTRLHPGCFALLPCHRDAIRGALARRQSHHPDAVPGFSEDRASPLDGALATLLWLDFWTTWALANCERPAIYNW